MKLSELILGMASVLLVIGLLAASVSNTNLVYILNGCQEDIRQNERTINDCKNSTNHWKGLYENFEPKIVYNNNTEYVNTTEYIYDTIYIGNRIYDVNRDGIIDYFDACEVLWYVNHDPRWLEQRCYDVCGNCWEYLYDVNIDGIVNVSDVEAIWYYCD